MSLRTESLKRRRPDAGLHNELKETLRIVDALQSDELCPCNRPVGGETIDPSAMANDMTDKKAA